LSTPFSKHESCQFIGSGKDSEMTDGIENLMRKLPPVPGRNAGLASVLGFLFGGIGLAIYFRNVVDLFFPMAIAVLGTVLIGADAGWLAGALVAALYGYYRVILSTAPVS
jgi:hypothetical protein